MIINYPTPRFKIRKEGEKEFILDSIRRKWILLTPEEWVRQNFIQYLLQEMKYPASLLAIEKEIQLGELTKRFDILVYDANHQPWMMIECKAMEVKLEEAVLQQVLRYNMSIPVRYLLITNGQYCMGWVREKGELGLIDALPAHGG
jgi:hypothetical protein